MNDDLPQTPHPDAATLVLTDQLIKICGPALDGKPNGIVINAMASAMAGLLLAIPESDANRRITLLRYAVKIIEQVITGDVLSGVPRHDK